MSSVGTTLGNLYLLLMCTGSLHLKGQKKRIPFLPIAVRHIQNLGFSMFGWHLQASKVMALISLWVGMSRPKFKDTG
jgi:hypothetical protein